MRYQSNRPKRQFLAGVRCTQCQKIDSTVQIVTFEPADEYIQCIHCGYSERRPTPSDIPTEDIRHQSEVTPVKFIPMPNNQLKPPKDHKQ